MVFVAFGAAGRSRGARRDRPRELERDRPHAGRGDAGARAVLRRLAHRPRRSCAARSVVPVRLLGIGLPLTIALGAVAAALVFDQLTIQEAVILAVVLAPTDAALGQAVVTEPRVPRADPAGPQRRERAQRRDLRAAAVRRGRGRRRRVRDLRRPQRRDAPARGDRLRGRSAASSAALLVAAIVDPRRPPRPDRRRWRQVIPAAGAALAYGIGGRARRARASSPPSSRA